MWWAPVASSFGAKVGGFEANLVYTARSKSTRKTAAVSKKQKTKQKKIKQTKNP